MNIHLEVEGSFAPNPMGRFSFTRADHVRSKIARKSYVRAAIESAADWLHRCDLDGLRGIASGVVGFDERGELEAPVRVGSFYNFHADNHTDFRGVRQSAFDPMDMNDEHKLRDRIIGDMRNFYENALPEHVELMSPRWGDRDE